MYVYNVYMCIQVLALGRMKSAMKSVFGGAILSARTAAEPATATAPLAHPEKVTLTNECCLPAGTE